MTEPLPKRFITAADAPLRDDPWCRVELLATAETVAAAHLLLVRATMPPGEAHNFHRHPGREEIIYVLEGRAEQWVGRERRVLGPGAIAHIPPDVPHATFNAGPEPLRFLAVLGPAEAEGPFTVDVFDEEPWATLRPPLPYPDYQPQRAPTSPAGGDVPA